MLMQIVYIFDFLTKQIIIFILNLKFPYFYKSFNISLNYY